MGKERFRLDKIVSAQTGISRKEVRLLCRGGRIRVDGRVTLCCEEKVDPTLQEISLDGQSLQYREFVYLMLHKPAGVLSASRDPKRETVVDLAPKEFAHRDLFPVGRLDRDTTGLLLLTDDGDTAHRLLSPRHHVPKVYEAVLDGPLPEDAVERFAQGITLADGSLCRPCQLRPVTQGASPTVQVVLTEGMYHQIKRMFGVLDLGVDRLHRISMGPLSLDEDLSPGECRELTAEEREKLLSCVKESNLCE